MAISREEVLMGREKAYPLNAEQEANLQQLLKALNLFRQMYGKPMYVTSGYRPAAINANVPGAAKKSAHMSCQACDFKDTDGSLDKYCMDNLYILEQCGLYLEHPSATQGWCHLQIRRPGSGNRVFKP